MSKLFRGGRRGVLLALCFLASMAALLWLGTVLGERPSLAQPLAPPPAAVPVSATPATRQDVPVYLSGIGAVQSLNTVLVRSRVDGTLVKMPVAEGQMVKAGELVAVIDPRPYQAVLDQAMAKKQQDEAQLANARRDLVRYSSLAQKDFASRQQVETQQATVAQLIAQVAGDNASVEAAQLNLSYCYITSSIDGRVGLRQVDPGNLIHASDPGGIFTVTEIQPIAVLFTLPQADLPRVSAAMQARKLPVTAAASEDGAGLDHGYLLTIDSAIDQATGTMKLKAIFPNAHQQLWPGQFVTARLLADVDRGVLTVPSVAVQHGPSGLYVYIVRPDSTVARQPVTVALDNGKRAVVANGLALGTLVVTSGQSRLDEGMRVTVRHDAAESEARAAGPA